MAGIDDGKGRGFKAEVNAEQELVVRAITEEEVEHASGIGDAFSWDSTELAIDSTDTMLFVRNDGSIPLICDRATIVGSNVICEWTVHIGALTTTPTATGSTTVVGVNLNETFSAKAADTTAFADEASVADGAIVDRIKTPIDNSIQHDLHGIILGKGHYIQFNQETASDSGSVVMVGHFGIPS